MKVLHVIPGLTARDGGPSDAVIHLCSALAAGGVEVALAFTATAGERPELDPVVRDLNSRGVKTIQLPRFGGERFKYASGFGRLIGKHIRDYDVVHIHAIFSYTSFSAARAARSAKRPYVVRPLGSLSPFGLRKSRIRKRLFLAAGMRSLIEDAAVIHCTSASEERDVRSSFRVRRTFSLPNGVDDAIFDPRRLLREPIVLFLGRLDRKKKAGVLIEAFALAQIAGWRLIVAGSGELAMEASLHEIASRLGVDAAFPGWVDGAQKRELLHRSSLFVLASCDENFGIAVAEAMAAGIPVTVSPNVGLADLIARTDSGWVVPAEPKLLASVLRAAADNAESRTTRGENARRTAEQHFRWSNVGAQMSRMYEELLVPSAENLHVAVEHP